MIDLSTDTGVRDTLREIAAWETTPAEAAVHELVAAAPPSARHDRRWLAAAAVLLVAVLAGVVAIRRDAGPSSHPAAAQGHWATMAPAPIPARFGPASVWTGSELLVWGGYDESGAARTDGAMYDPATDSWRQIADFPFEHWRRRAPVGASGFYSEAAVYGAWVGHEALFVVQDPVAEWAWDIVAYDPAADSWRTAYRARFDHLPSDLLVRTEGDGPIDEVRSVAVHDGQLVLIGWRSDLATLGITRFDPTTAAWTPFEAIPGSGDQYIVPAQTQLVDDRYLVVMRTGSKWLGAWGWIVDLVAGGTVTIAEPPFPGPEESWGLEGVLGSDLRFVGNGNDGQGGLQRVAYVLDVHTGLWTVAQAPPSGPVVDDDARAQLVATPYGDLWLGGHDISGATFGGLHSSVAHLGSDAEMTRWATLPNAPIDLQRSDFVAVWTGAEVIVWGGALDTTAFADGARYTLP